MQYKLTYFDLRGRGETSRMLFALADVDFEDVRVGSDEWKGLKKDMPFAQLPCLEVEGHKFRQSRAIERFLADRFQLRGDTEFEKCKSDMIVDYLEDVATLVSPIYLEEDQEIKEQLRKKLEQEGTINYILSHLDGMVTSMGGFLNSQVIWADLATFNGLRFLKDNGIRFDGTKFLKLEALCKRVANEPKIAAWLKKRPIALF